MNEEDQEQILKETTDKIVERFMPQSGVYQDIDVTEVLQSFSWTDNAANRNLIAMALKAADERVSSSHGQSFSIDDPAAVEAYLKSISSRRKRRK